MTSWGWTHTASHSRSYTTCEDWDPSTQHQRRCVQLLRHKQEVPLHYIIDSFGRASQDGAAESAYLHG